MCAATSLRRKSAGPHPASGTGTANIGTPEELGQFLQVVNGRFVGGSLPTGDGVGRGLDGLGQFRLALSFHSAFTSFGKT
jgi:hypothetical protein